jgi:hypothetical protein
MFLFFVGCPLSGAIDIGILHSLYNQQKKAILYEKQYLCLSVKCMDAAALLSDFILYKLQNQSFHARIRTGRFQR